METVTFENLPNAVATLKNEFKALKELLLQTNEPRNPIENPISIDNIPNLSERANLQFMVMYIRI